MEQADHGRASLSGANLEGAVVRHCRMNRVSLIGASLCRADFSQSNMIKADLRNADLSGALFVSTNMNGADFTLANWDHTATLPKSFDSNNVEFLDVGV